VHLTEQMARPCQKRSDPKWCPQSPHLTVWMPIFTQTLGTFSNHSTESVALAASQAPSLTPSIAPQACPQMSRDHRATRSDHPEFVRKCDQPPFQITPPVDSPFVREHQSHPADVAPIHSASQHSTPRPSFCTARPTPHRSCAHNLN
jgi:hypothetical protein